MKIDPKHFRFAGGKPLTLAKWPTLTDPVYKSQKDYKKLLQAQVSELNDLQHLLYASDSYSLLLIFQAMDAAGKDGAISHLLRGINPQGCDVHSFKHPSAEELQHDFLWRTTCRLPSRGRIGVFNRSYYEEVLIVRVHREILRSEGIPGELEPTPGTWKSRYQSIVDFEDHLHRNGTQVIKFFLHLSKEEQRKRFLERIDEPSKNWKFSQADLIERKYWDEYMTAYEQCLSATATDSAPWTIVPADDKFNARLIISRVVIEALSQLKMSYPKLTPDQQKELRKLRKQLEK